MVEWKIVLTVLVITHYNHFVLIGVTFISTIHKHLGITLALTSPLFGLEIHVLLFPNEREREREREREFIIIL